MTNTPMTTNHATKIYMDHARSLYRCLRQPHNPVPPAVLPQDQQRWRVAPAPDGRGTPDDHKPRPPHRAQGFWIAAGVLLASNLGSVLLAMPAG
jgi:hypothetical protein